jgi:hypothetical protein
MPEGGGLREAVRDVARHASAVARLQGELTRSELRSSGLLGFGAAVFAVMSFLLLTTLFVAALAIPLPLWLAILIVMLVYMALAGVLGVAFRASRQSGVAKDQARITMATLRSARSNAGGDATPQVTAAPTGSPSASPAAPLVPDAQGSHVDGV